MTEKLFYENVYCRVFYATVLNSSIKESGDGFETVLDRTAFYPEGGGQAGDRGFLFAEAGGAAGQAAADVREAGKAAADDETAGKDAGTYEITSTNPAAAAEAAEEHLPEDEYHVLDTYEKGDAIVHLTDRQIPAGTRVRGVLDWQWRFDRMQNHSGEHIVSGIIHERFGYNNVGFHMSADRMTIDLSGELSETEIREIEAAANRVVWADREIRTDVYTEEEAANVEFRSKKELHGLVRVVTIPGADVCACCGTHVARTGEIGPIIIISHMRFHSGTRMELMCGRWAYDYQARIMQENRKVSSLLSSPPEKTGDAVAKNLEQLNSYKFRITEMKYESIGKMAEKLAGKGKAVIFAKEYDPKLLQKLCNAVMETSGGTVLAISANGEALKSENGSVPESEKSSYFYCAGEKDGNLRDFVKAMNSSLNGRGGGKPFFQQGSFTAAKEEILAFLRDSWGEAFTVSEC